MGLVGCGRLAQLGYVPALAHVPALSLTAVAEPDERRRAEFGVPGYAGADELLAAEALDAIVVASPVDAHLAGARAAALRGIHSLVEKPPARDAAGAAELAALEPPPWIGFNRRFDPALRRLRELSAGGGPLELSIELLHRQRSWGPYVADDDALLDLGPHALDLVRWLAGDEIVRVRTRSLASRRAELEVETEHGRATVRLAADARYREHVVIRGRGEAVRGGLLDTLHTRLARRPHPLVESLAGQLSAFAVAVRGGDGAGLASARDAVAVMTALDAARRSAANRGAWEPAR